MLNLNKNMYLCSQNVHLFGNNNRLITYKTFDYEQNF